MDPLAQAAAELGGAPPTPPPTETPAIDDMAGQVGGGAEPAADQFKQFVDRYGVFFNNDTGIANLAFAEMERLGVDGATEAASEAFQKFLEAIADESVSVLENVKLSEKKVSELMDKLNKIQESFQKAQGKAETPAPASGGGAPDALPPVDAAGAGGAAPEMGGEPPAGAPPPDAGGAPPPDMGGGGLDAGNGELAPSDPSEGAVLDEGGLAPPDMGGGGDMPLPPEQVASDERLKNIRSKFASYRQTRANTVPSDQNLKKPAWKPQRGLIDLFNRSM